MDSEGQNDILILLGVVALFFYLVFTGLQVTRPTTKDGLFRDGDFVKTNSILASNQAKIVQGADQTTVFNLSDYIHLSVGNARSETNSTNEYVVIEADSQMPRSVLVSGWSLENGGAERLYDNYDQVVRGVTKRVVIPNGTYLLSGLGGDRVHPIFLKPGGKVVVATGRTTGVRSEFKIDTSFQENICTGYIESFKDYNFTPSFSQSCPNPKMEVGLTNLSNACQDFIESRIGRCQTPIFTDYQRVNGQEEWGNFMDGQLVDISRNCRVYIEDHFNYGGCLKYHVGEPLFLIGDWRVYLGQVWEMWVSKDEHIKLYDQTGVLIDELRY